MIDIICGDNRLALGDRVALSNGGTPEMVSFAFPPSWDGMQRTAIFWKSPWCSYAVPLEMQG